MLQNLRKFSASLLHQINRYRAFDALKSQYRINERMAKEKEQRQEDFYRNCK